MTASFEARVIRGRHSARKLSYSCWCALEEWCLLFERVIVFFFFPSSARLCVVLARSLEFFIRSSCLSSSPPPLLWVRKKEMGEQRTAAAAFPRSSCLGCYRRWEGRGLFARVFPEARSLARFMLSAQNSSLAQTSFFPLRTELEEDFACVPLCLYARCAHCARVAVAAALFALLPEFSSLVFFVIVVFVFSCIVYEANFTCFSFLSSMLGSLRAGDSSAPGPCVGCSRVPPPPPSRLKCFQKKIFFIPLETFFSLWPFLLRDVVSLSSFAFPWLRVFPRLLFYSSPSARLR